MKDGFTSYDAYAELGYQYLGASFDGAGWLPLGSYEAEVEAMLAPMGEWWKQLYGESEGKDGVGIFPASVDLTPDLHSMGQYIQDGRRMLQETVVFFDRSKSAVTVPADEANLDGLNYLAGRELSYINEKAMEATKAAHISGGVPVTTIHLDSVCEAEVGALIYFFEFACGVSGYMMQWGIVQKHDPFLYGERVKAFLRLGATRTARLSYPNPTFGYGALCLSGTLSYLERYQWGGFRVWLQT